MVKRNSLLFTKMIVLPLLTFLAVWGVQAFIKGRLRPVETPEQRREILLRKQTAFYHLSYLSGCALNYADDHFGYLPSSQNWEDALRPYAAKDGGRSLEEIVTSPFLPGPRRFAMNKALSGVNIYSYQKSGGKGIVLFYDAISPTPNASGNLEPLPPLSNDEQTAVGFLEADADPRTFYNANVISPIHDFASHSMAELKNFKRESRKLELEQGFNAVNPSKPLH